MGDRLERGQLFDTDKAKWLLRYWHRMGGRFLTFVGGEPSLHAGLAQLVEASVCAGYEKVMIDTNALLPERLLLIPPTSIYYLRVSLDGASPETHDRVRGSGNFERAIAGIRRLIKAGYTVRLTSTIFRFNQHEAAELVELAHEFGVKVVNFHSFTPEGCGSKNADWALSPMEWYRFCQRLEQEVGQSDVEVRVPPSWVKRADLPGLAGKGFQGCLGCSLDRLSIFPDGRCYACSLLFDFDVNFGFMRDDGFALNTVTTSNEFELFTSAALASDDPLAMGCPAENMLGMKSAMLEGLVPVCRLWRTVLTKAR